MTDKIPSRSPSFPRRAAWTLFFAPILVALTTTTACSEDDDSDSSSDGIQALQFSTDSTTARVGPRKAGGTLWLLSAVDGTDEVSAVLNIEMYTAFGGPTSAGVVEMTETETNYADCAVCIILNTENCKAHGDHYHCDRSFMPRAQGQLNLEVYGDEAGESFKATLEDIVFQEVEIADDYKTTPVEGGQVYRLDRYTFDETLTAYEVADCGGHGTLSDGACTCDEGYNQDPDDATACVADGEVCSGHGHLHGSDCHCDSGYKQDPDDASKCIAE